MFAGFVEPVTALVAELLEHPTAHESIGAAWVREELARDTPTVGKTIARLDPKLPAIRTAAIEWLAILEERQDAPARFDAARLVRKRLAPCDDELWVAVAAALTARGGTAECIEFTADWRSRPRASSWALLTAARVRREAAQDDDAFAIVTHAAALPTDGGSRSHRAWLAFELAVRGERREAEAWLERAGQLERVAVLGSVATLTRAVLAASAPAIGAFARYETANAALARSRAEQRIDGRRARPGPRARAMARRPSASRWERSSDTRPT